MRKIAIMYLPKVLRIEEPQPWRILFGETEIPNSELSVAAFIVDTGETIEKLVASPKEATQAQLETLEILVNYSMSFLAGKLTRKEFFALSQYII